jgi:type II secretory pathway predicted ATPase ExeA
VDQAQQHQFCLGDFHVLCSIYLRQAAGEHGSRQPRWAQTYREFFGLDMEPFSIVPQPGLLCESHSQRRAHKSLRWLVDRRQGLGVLLGPVGTGKTLLCHALSEELSVGAKHAIALLLTPSHRTEYALMTDVLKGWQVTPEHKRSLRDLEQAAHRFLLNTAIQQRQTAVLIIDEAQTLTRKQLLQICKLLNWQDGGEQLLQVILAGQPSLQGKLERVPALRDRIVIRFTLTPMTLVDTERMIRERLLRSGRRKELFAPGAVRLVHQYSGGMPRRATILCLCSMWLAYQEGTRYISAEVVRTAIDRYSDSSLFDTLPSTATRKYRAPYLKPLAGGSRSSRFLCRLKELLRYATRSTA